MNKCSHCGQENDDAAIACTGCATPLSKSAGPSAPAARPSSVTCPKCGTAGNFTQAVELRRSFSLGLFLLGGIWAVIFRNAGRPKRVRCNQCEEVFSIRTTASKISGAVFWLLIAPGIVTIAGLLIALIWILLHG